MRAAAAPDDVTALDWRTSMTPRFSPGGVVALSAVALTGATLMAALAWAHMSAFNAAYGAICGSDTGRVAHCPACYGAVVLLLLGLSSLGLAQALRRPPLPAQR
jgi:hypothetical protein